MIDAVTTRRYLAGEIHRISADLAHLEQLALGAVDRLPAGRRP